MLRYMIAVTMLVAGSPVAAPAQTVGGVKITSQYCKKAYAELKYQRVHRAFAISPDGKVCDTAYGYGSKGEAQASAKEHCEEKGERRCKVVAAK